MPTYRNTKGFVVYDRDYVFSPFETKAVAYYLYSSNLELLSEEPYYNPMLDDQDISASDTTITVPINKDCKFVRIFPDSFGTNITLFFGDVLNVPGFIIKEPITIHINQRFSNLLFKFEGSGKINLKQMSDNIYTFGK